MDNAQNRETRLVQYGKLTSVERRFSRTMIGDLSVWAATVMWVLRSIFPAEGCNRTTEDAEQEGIPAYSTVAGFLGLHLSHHRLPSPLILDPYNKNYFRSNYY